MPNDGTSHSPPNDGPTQPKRRRKTQDDIPVNPASTSQRQAVPYTGYMSTSPFTQHAQVAQNPNLISSPYYPPPPGQYSAYQSSYPNAPFPAAIPSPTLTESPAGSASQQRPPTKRKRSTEDKPSEDEPSPSDASGSTLTRAQQKAADKAEKKRTKTQRACDSCRSRKIRCDVLEKSEPPLCHHCKQYGFECSFFLPITETRFKKKKLEEEAKKKELELANNRMDSPPPISDARFFGPTSTAHLLHSQATISSKVYADFDERHDYSWEVSGSGDGMITMKPTPTSNKEGHTKPIELRIERSMMETLINAYFEEVSPLLPIVTRDEFVANPTPAPILLYSMCLVSAARRGVPQGVFDTIRHAVNAVIKAEDVLSTASIVNIQSLLILCMMGDCHSHHVPNALSALWLRLGTAIRMAQDLGLHRAESVKANIEMRRRLWGACVISDRWTSLTYGHPYMIQVEDCDTRLPSSGGTDDLYMDELVRLSVILGRVLRTIYSPSGLAYTTDEMLYTLLSDLETWKANLPDNLQFRGPETHKNAGLLHLFYSCVCMIFWRVFMRISYTCPAHLKFGLDIEQWSALVKLTSDSIDWLELHEDIYDVWLYVAYAATSCALVQYHTWARRKEAEAVISLRKLRDCVHSWEKGLTSEHASTRQKTAEIINLLYESTQGPPLPMEIPVLNPTGGVSGKAPPLAGLDYQKDPTRPGGGVFVARGEAIAAQYHDLPNGVIVLAEDTPPPDSHQQQQQQRHQQQYNDDQSFMLSSSAFAPPLPPHELNRPRRMTSGSSQHPYSTPMSDVRTPIQQHAPFYNVNPAMDTGSVNMQGNNVQVMNVLDVPQGTHTLEQFAQADDSFLDGIPGVLFDWGQWENYFSSRGQNMLPAEQNLNLY